MDEMIKVPVSVALKAFVKTMKYLDYKTHSITTLEYERFENDLEEEYKKYIVFLKELRGGNDG